MSARPVPMDFETFAARMGGSTADVGDAGAHKRGRRQSEKQWARIIRHIDTRSGEVVAKRSAARREYQAAVERGDIRPLTHLEKLEQTAAGHPDNPSVQAARRLLAERIGVQS